MPSLTERVQKAWNAFRNRDPTPVRQQDIFSYSSAGSLRPDRRRPKVGNERSIIAPLLNRIAVDAAAVDIRHVKLDKYKRYQEDVEDELNDILTLEANLDQSARDFKQDVYASLLDEGYIAVCPIIADVNYQTMSINKIQSARVGKIMAWYPKEIDVELYNEETGQRETIRMPKKLCVILQNPFYDIMNAPNSLMMRLRKKLALLDQIDDKTASGKLDMIIQLPYATRHETQKERAEQRRHDLEVQLAGSRYGIGYIDASEKVIQLGRPLDNNLQAQIDSLTKQLHDQLGVCPEILNGNANEMTKLNYNNNIIEPLVTTFVDGMVRKWLTKAARTQGHSILSFHNPFRLVPVGDVAELGDKLIRNEILTPNEMRGILGFKPSDQEGADSLRNPNMPTEMDPMAEEDDAAITGDTTDLNDGVAPEEETAESETTEAASEEEPLDEENLDAETVQNVIETMDDRQVTVLNYLLDRAAEGQNNVNSEE